MELSKRERKLLLAGSILPDCYKFILYPVRSSGLLGVDYGIDLFFEPLNSFVGIILLSLFAASLLRTELKHGFRLLFWGSLSHLLLDTLSYSGPRLLIPLSWRGFEAGLLWPDNPVPAILATVSVLIARFYRGEKAVSSMLSGNPESR